MVGKAEQVRIPSQENCLFMKKRLLTSDEEAYSFIALPSIKEFYF